MSSSNSLSPDDDIDVPSTVAEDQLQKWMVVELKSMVVDKRTSEVYNRSLNSVHRAMLYGGLSSSDTNMS